MTVYGATNIHTDNAVLTDLIATRGMAGMMNTIWLILCAMCFGGAKTPANRVDRNSVTIEGTFRAISIPVTTGTINNHGVI